MSDHTISLTGPAVERLARQPAQAARLFERVFAWDSQRTRVGLDPSLPTGFVIVQHNLEERTLELGISPEGDVSS